MSIYFLTVRKDFEMRKNKTMKWELIPLLLLVSIVPLIVRLYTYNNNLSQFDWYPENETTTDVFLYYKSLAIIAIAGIMCLILIYRYIKNRKSIRISYQFIPLIVYACCTILSTLFSKYKYFCFHGMTEVFETVWVLLGYCIIAFYAYQLIQTLDDVDCIMRLLTIGLAFMLIIGLMQASGHDLFATNFGKKLISPSQYWNSLDGITMTFEKGHVYLTVYNPNYVPLYFGLMIPIEVALLIRNKRAGYRILYAGMIIASCICLFASQNRSMVIGLAAAAFLTLLVLHRQIIHAWKIVLPIIVCIIIFSVGYFSYNPALINKFIFRENQKETLSAERAISKIETGDEYISMIYKGNELRTFYSENDDGTIDLHLTDDTGTDIQYTADDFNYQMTATDDRFQGITVQPVLLEEGGPLTIWIRADNYDWYFQKGDDGTYYYLNNYGKLDKIICAEEIGKDFLTTFVDERARIWSQTFPLLKDKIIFGSGPDTFALEYPQDNYVGKTYDGTIALIDVKPHNAYLQTAVQEGVLAMIALVVLYLWFLFDGIKIYSKVSFNNPIEIIGISLVIALGTHMAVSLVNDSNVCISPLFWLLLGMGISINEIVKKQEKQNSQKNR